MEAGDPSPMPGLRILIVEDHQAMREIISRGLESMRTRFPASEIIIAENMQTALPVIFRSPPPDIVLLDAGLPDSTTEETVKQVPAFGKMSAIVLVTGYPEEMIRKLPGGETVTIIQKEGPRWIERIINAMMDAVTKRRSEVCAGCCSRLDAMDANIRILRELIGNDGAA